MAESSLTRRFLLWFFEHPPFSPYVSISCAVDMTPSRAYLASLKSRGTPVTLQTLLAAAIGRTYAQFRAANASVVGGRILRFEEVGVVAPIDLSSVPGALETGLIVLEKADKKSLIDLSRSARKTVEGERRGDRDNALFRRLVPLAEKSPRFVMDFALDAFDRAARIPTVARALRRAVPATVGLSNPGATLPMPTGGFMRGGAMSFPDKIIALGSLFGVGPMQDEVVPVDGQPAVRPMLPIIFVFDHRLFDGVYAGKILNRLLTILQDPESVFGANGDVENA